MAYFYLKNISSSSSQVGSCFGYDSSGEDGGSIIDHVGTTSSSNHERSF